jgi:hypothetical protein
MKAVWEIELLSGAFEVPFGAQLLSIQFQGLKICSWWLVNPKEPNTEVFDCRIFETDFEFDAGLLEHWATLQDLQGSALHVFGTKSRRGV